MELNKSLPQALDVNGQPITTGAIVKNTLTGETFLVRGMYRQDEGPSQVAFASQVEVVSPRPDTMEEVVARIDESRERGHARGGIGAVKSGSSQADGDTIVWGW